MEYILNRERYENPAIKFENEFMYRHFLVIKGVRLKLSRN